MSEQPPSTSQRSAPEPPSRRWIPRSLGLLIGLSAAALARSRGHEVAWIVIAVTATTLFVSTVASATIARWVDRVMATFAGWVGALLTFVLLVAQFYLLLWPVGLFGRLLGRRTAITRFDATETTYWTPVERNGELPERTYMKETPRRAGGSGFLNALGLVALLVVVDVGLGSLLNRAWLDDYTTYRKFYRGWEPAPGMRDAAAWFEPWMDEWAYTYRRTRWEPFAGWKREDFHGTYINIQGGVRRTWQSARARDPGALRIWLFGGSTMWGDGARDEHTIPSELARIIDAHGISAEVINHGEAGWSQWEERLKFEALLAAGDRADLALFYDGGNEHINQLRVGGTPGPTPMMADKMRSIIRQQGELMPVVKRSELVTTLVAQISESLHPPWVPGATWVKLDPERHSEGIARTYLASVTSAQATAARYGVATTFVWQPWFPTTSQPNVEDAAFLEASLRNTENLRALCRRTGAFVRESPLVHDLSGALDGAKEPLYIDVVHLNERGNEAIARKLFDVIEPALRDRTRQP